MNTKAGPVNTMQYTMNAMKSLLYVDDEPMNLMLFELNFGNNYAIFTAESGTTGLEVLEANPEISIVFSDMRMPGMSGIEFIRKAKKDYPSVKFLILTGFGITDEIQEALHSGLIAKYISKPFNTKDITDSITENV
jgi:two-component system response regulator (stage 0 sporulation protein F)